MTTAELEELIWKIDLMLSDTPAMLFTTEESRWDDFLQRVQPADWHNPSCCGVCDCSRNWIPQKPATLLGDTPEGGPHPPGSRLYLRSQLRISQIFSQNKCLTPVVVF
jgi:hypothetical protein